MAFERPKWLGPTPHSAYWSYCPADGLAACRAWEAVTHRNVSLHDAHCYALEGYPVYVAQMRQFYINLTTERLKS